MFVPGRNASALPRRFAPRFIRVTLTAGLCALLAGCTGPARLTAAHPADPDSSARPVTYRNVIRPYAKQRPGDPSEWRQSNERVAPQEKP
jgi:hypothetical protein